ncbi:hypothetical protein [Pseudoduganella violaceinigra]|uniref:hypothetical protein n=1 Tax=Pseudoduganella violaceinigra TaxID=246602 RepID=UPI0003FBA91A|nr:hypothetical protein [Pseudoduganella violaceinigra]
MKLKSITRAMLLSIAAAGAAAPHANAGSKVPPVAQPAASKAQRENERLATAYMADIRAALDAAAAAAKEDEQDFPATPEYSRNLYDFLYEAPLYEKLVKATFALGDVSGGALHAYYLSHVPKQELIAKLVPQAMKIVSPELAANMLKIVREPAYGKRARIQLAAMGGAGGESGTLSAEEQKTLVRIDAEPAALKFRKLEPRLEQLVRSAVIAARSELELKLASEALAALAKMQSEIPAAGASGRPAAIHTIGFEPWDQFIRASGNCNNRIALAFHRYNKDLAELKYFELVKSVSVVGRQNYQEAAGLIDKAEDALATALTALDAAIREREREVRASAFARFPLFRSQQDGVTAGLYTFAGDLGESYRNMFSAQRRLLAYLEQHKEQARIEGGKLVFEDDALVAEVNELLKRVTETAREVDAVVDRQAERDEAAMTRARANLEKAAK